MSALANVEFDYRDLQLKLHKEFGIKFDYCAVGGHDSHGKVERIIRSVQQGLDDCGLKTARLHSTGLQTLCKIVENSYNNVPIGYSYGRDQNNTPILKIISPNMLRMGRNNKRALDGPFRLARGTRELLNKIDELYASWFKIWQDAVIPKLIYQPKWYDNEKDLCDGDIVYFQKKDGLLANKWVVGKVEQIIRGRDQIIRKVMIKYFNGSEGDIGEPGRPRFTERSVRKIVKLFSIDEFQIEEDLSELQKRLDEMDGQGAAQEIVVRVRNEDQVSQVPEDVDPTHVGQDGGPAAGTRSRKRCQCCCWRHCNLSFHSMGPEMISLTELKCEDVVFGSFSLDEARLNGREEEMEDEFVEKRNLTEVLKSFNLVL